MIETVELTPAVVGLGNLHEAALLALFADTHYRILTRGKSTTPREIVNKAGEPLYPSVVAVEAQFPAQRPLASHALWHRFDLGVWSDDLDAIAANPLVIEIKKRFSTASIAQALAAMQSMSNARAALVVYLDYESASPRDLRSVRFPVLAIALQDLITRMRTATFAEVIRDLRNRSVHGLPPS